jgi:hypothetical protein
MEKFSKFLEKLQNKRSDYVTDPYDQQSMYEDIASNVESLSPEAVAGIAGVESEFGKYQKPLLGGSAKGTFQLMPNTIKYLNARLEKKGSEPEVNPLREEARLTSELMKQHESELKKTLGDEKELTPADFFVKHNLGQGMGRKLLRAPAIEEVGEILPEKVIESNPSIYKGKTKEEALAEIRQRLNKKSNEFKFEDRSPLGFLKD